MAPRITHRKPSASANPSICIFYFQLQKIIECKKCNEPVIVFGCFFFPVMIKKSSAIYYSEPDSEQSCQQWQGLHVAFR